MANAKTEQMAVKAILGGTFNPPHQGHIGAALSAADKLGIQDVYLMPCKLPPHKSVDVTEAHRVNMIALCCDHNQRLKQELIELSLPSPSYTVKTLRELRKRNSDTICFFIGADSLYNLDKWYEWQQLLDYCHLVVMRRDDEFFSPPSSVSAWLNEHVATDSNVIYKLSHGKVLLVETPLFPISSTELRASLSSNASSDVQLRSDTNINVSNWVSNPVLEYIKENQLYKS